MKTLYVYIMANLRSKVLYTGVTNNLARRISEHKSRKGVGFTAKYNVTSLVYYESIEGPNQAIEREKRIKRLHRSAKVQLINSMNPEWVDLAEALFPN